MELIRRFASFIVNSEYDSIPTKAIELCRRNILDFLGAALAGTKTDVAKIIRGFVSENVESTVSGVIGGHFKTSPAMAPLASIVVVWKSPKPSFVTG